MSKLTLAQQTAATSILGVDTLPDTLATLSFTDLLARVADENYQASDRIKALHDDIVELVDEQADCTREVQTELTEANQAHDDFQRLVRHLIYKSVDIGGQATMNDLNKSSEMKDVKTALHIY